MPVLTSSVMSKVQRIGSKCSISDENDHFEIFRPSYCPLYNVGGVQEQIKILKEQVIIPFLNPTITTPFGIQPPTAILFHGPPGTGKTLLARSLASTLHEELFKLGTPVQYIEQCGGQCFSEYFGQSEKKLRNLFRQAQLNSPCILFLDEIDTLCPARKSGGRDHEAVNNIVSTFLGLVNDATPGKILIIGATNRKDSIDPAVLRNGRLGIHLEFHLPDPKGRKQILEIHLKKRSLRCSESLLENICRDPRVAKFSGADLQALCHAVASVAFRGAFPNLATMTFQEIASVREIKLPQPITAKDFDEALILLKNNHAF